MDLGNYRLKKTNPWDYRLGPTNNRPNTISTNTASVQLFPTLQKLGEPIRRSRTGSEFSRDVVVVESPESSWNSTNEVVSRHTRIKHIEEKMKHKC